MHTWHYNKFFVEQSYSDLKDYVETITNALEREENDLHSRVSKLTEELDEKCTNETIEQYIDQFEKHGTLFPNLAYRSIVLLAYSTFEHHLMNFCNDIQKAKCETISCSDIKGEFCGTQNYLLLMCGIKISDLSEWNAIQYLKRIRNLLIHHNGFIGYEVKDDLMSYLKNTNGIALSGGTLIIKKDYCLETIDILSISLLEMIEQIKVAMIEYENNLTPEEKQGRDNRMYREMKKNFENK